MPYRTAIPRLGKVHTLRVRPVGALAVLAATILVTLMVALGVADYPRTASVVVCSQGHCTVYRARVPGAWQEIPCDEADAQLVALTASRPFVWHRLYTWDFPQTHQWVSA